jgi:peptidoglycan/xylan/chitin deacetylase (PgdA/CDA1 family)
MKLFFLSLLAFFSSLFNHPAPSTTISISPTPTQTASVLAIPTASPSAEPTPKPLTFLEMNDLYGPCTNTPVLMYHHVSTPELAKAGGYASLTVYTDTFDKQMSYLSTKGYTSISPPDLLNFFNSGTKLPSKAVLLTFDDAYADFGEYAVPIMNKYGFKATLFAPTGLLENPGYLTWSRISNLGSSIYVANHTWSHHNIAAKKDVIIKEVSTANTQLTEHGLDPLKVFAYPYGTISSLAVSTIKDLGMKMAFTTIHGRILCAKQILTLPRLRIGNGALSSYGL